MLPGDSTLYINGGANKFLPTVFNKILVKLTLPKGMVFIPGGEFSMGAPNPIGIKDGGKAAMEDCRPIHRVKLNAFLWMRMKLSMQNMLHWKKAPDIKQLQNKPQIKLNSLMCLQIC